MNSTRFPERLRTHFKVRQAHLQADRHIRRLATSVAEHCPQPSQAPVLFFNASTRLTGLSLNAGFSLISAWSLRLQGIPVVSFVCQRGMTQCVLGTDRHDPPQSPPCQSCINQSEAIYSSSQQVSFTFQHDPDLDNALSAFGLDELMDFRYEGVPLGELVLPSVRWILRRHHLQDNPTTLRILRQYLRSAWSIKGQFQALVEQVQPSAVVVFNGMQYPEATARWVARQKGLKVYSHEVGLRPMSAFFTEGDATAYPLEISSDFQLNEAQNARLDTYLQARFKGNFIMAGVKFWPEISQLDQDFLALADRFKQVVPVFTNVIFDTSQPHANVLFQDMFIWLDEVLKVAKNHSETLFVIRAHPDEARKGKASEESVAEWASKNQVESLPNIKFIPPEQFISSYDLIRMSKFVMIYNSTIGMEASIMGAVVLSAGKSRFTQNDLVYFPADRTAYLQQLEEFLNAGTLEAPARFSANARRFLYYQLYRSSLSFEDYLEEDQVWSGYVCLKDFDWQTLLPENSPVLKTISDGIAGRGNFLLTEEV